MAVRHNLMENARMDSLQLEHELLTSEEKKAQKAETILSETLKSAERAVSRQSDEMWKLHRGEDIEIDEDEKARQIEEELEAYSAGELFDEDETFDEESEDLDLDHDFVSTSDSYEKYSGQSRAQRRKSNRKAQNSQRENAYLAGLSVQKMYNDGNMATHEVLHAVQKATRLVKKVKSH